MKIVMGKVSSHIIGPIKIPKKEIQALERDVFFPLRTAERDTLLRLRAAERNILLPLRGALSFSESADKEKQKLALEAAIEVHALACKLCLALIQVPIETLAQIPNIRRGFPATMSLHPEVMQQVGIKLRELGVGNPKARSKSTHPGAEVARSNLRVMYLLRNPTLHSSLPGKRKKCPFIHEIDALPPFGPESAKEWWEVMKKMYDVQGSDKKPLGGIFQFDNKAIHKLVRSENSKSKSSSKLSAISQNQPGRVSSKPATLRIVSPISNIPSLSTACYPSASDELWRPILGRRAAGSTLKPSLTQPLPSPYYP